ncbi:MAG: hypothetical protein L6R37_003702 [Teloschistes peruensis]|nr:MAG: hypothetical protein L6R37_003702 [Teloschistes peruensis]
MPFQLSSAADRGFTKASSYDTFRPSYPAATVDDLLAKLQVKGLKEARIVDLGAGTGKFTELLASRDEEYEVTAVEPHAEMRKQCEGKKLRGVTVMEGNAATIPVKSQSVDAVVVAQVFDKQLSSTPFTIQAADPLFSLPLGENSTEFTYWLSPQAIWERLHSLSQIAVLEGEELAVRPDLELK